MAKKKYKRSLFDKIINVICYVLLVFFSINEFSHLYRTLDTIDQAPNLYEKHYSLTGTFPFVGAYYLMKPEGYNPKYKYPLVIVLHGVGSPHAYAAEELAKPSFRNKYPFFVMVPIAPTRAFWLSTIDKNYRMPQNIPYPDHLPQVIAGIDDIQSEYSIDESKIMLTGHSMGGSGVIGGLERYPDLFDVGIASAGAWSPNEISNIKSPLFIYHGARDAAVPVNYSLQLKAAARAQGKPIRVSVIKGKDHGVGSLVYSQSRVWDKALSVLE